MKQTFKQACRRMLKKHSNGFTLATDAVELFNTELERRGDVIAKIAVLIANKQGRQSILKEDIDKAQIYLLQNEYKQKIKKFL